MNQRLAMGGRSLSPTPSCRCPVPPALDPNDDGRPGWPSLALLRVSAREQLDAPLTLRTILGDPGPTVHAHPPETCPILVVAVDEEAHPWLCPDVGEPLQLASAFRLLVDDEPHGRVVEDEDNGDDVRRAVRAYRREVSDPSLTEAPLGFGEVHASEDRSGGLQVS